MKNKKGSHVGVVLSFTIFVIAIIFIYAIVGSPIKSNPEKEASFLILKNSILNEISLEVPVVRMNTAGLSCVEFENPRVDFSNLSSFAIDSSGNEVPSYIFGSNTIFEDGHNFVKIYLTNSSIENSISYSQTPCVLTEPKSISYETFIFEKKIISFLDLVLNNYTLVKDGFPLTEEDEFNFLFEYSNGTVIGVEGREVKIKTDVYVQKYKVPYISINGKLSEGNLIIKIW